MFEATTQIRVRYAETDQMNIVYYGNYAQYFEVGRVESIRQLGIAYKDMEASGIIMPVVEMNIKFLRPATYDELITVKTQLRTRPSGHKIQFHQEVFNETGKLLAAGNVTLFFLETGTWKKTGIPAYFDEKIKVYFPMNNDFSL